MVQKHLNSARRDRDYAAPKKATTGGIFDRLNFFNLREAGGADRQSRFGRGQRRSIKNFT